MTNYKFHTKEVPTRRSADVAWNKIRAETVSYVGYCEWPPLRLMNDEKRRFESQVLPLMSEAYNLARWLMKNDQDAQDVVQEAYLRAFRFFEGYHGDSARAWLLKIVRNVCLNHFARRAAEGNVVPIDCDSLEIEDTEPLPSTTLAKKGAIDTVRAAIEALPEDFRAVIVLREIDGLSYKEIAEVTDLPIGTVMSRLARARQHLATLLIEKKELGQL